MNRILSSRITKIVLLCIGYIAAALALRDINWSFNYYLSEAFVYLRRAFDTFNIVELSSIDTYSQWRPQSTEALFWVALFLACTVLFIISILKTPGAKKPYKWRSVDYSLLAILTYCTVFAVTCLILAYIRFYMPLFYIPFTVIVYLAVMLFLAETVARIRDKQIRQTLYWSRFFEAYPPIRSSKGFLMAMLLCLNLFLLLVLCPLVLQAYGPGEVFILLLVLILPTIMIAVLTYFCRFILSLSEEYEMANAEKIRSERFKVELITNVSHDIRSPLTTIINYVDFLKTLPIENSDFTEYVGVLDSKSSRLKVLIDDLMEASKASTGNLSLEKKEIDLVEIIGQIAGEFDDKFAERDLALVFPQPTEPLIANADSRHLWRVLENLFGNAAKYALQGTRVFAELSQRGGKPVFVLKNTSQEPLDLCGDELVEQFIRGDRARQTEGNGLGLYIAKSLMDLMGGQLFIRTNGDLFEAELLFG